MLVPANESVKWLGVGLRWPSEYFAEEFQAKATEIQVEIMRIYFKIVYITFLKEGIYSSFLVLTAFSEGLKERFAKNPQLSKKKKINGFVINSVSFYFLFVFGRHFLC